MKAFLTLIATLVVAGCEPHSGTTCGEDSEAVAYARALSDEQLSVLYDEMFRLRTTPPRPQVEFNSFSRESPESVRFIKAVRIRPNHPVRPNIMLAGCLDEFVFLDFFGTDEGPPRIELSWFDGPYSRDVETLWQAEG